MAQEARDLVRKKAQNEGFDQRQRLHVEPGFDWDEINALMNNLNLFSQKTFVEIYNPTAKFDKKATAILNNYVDNATADQLLLVTCNKLSSAQKNAKWFKTLEKNAVIITANALNPAELTSWINARCQKKQISLSQEALGLLIELSKGNLLATEQAIEKLALLYPNQDIDSQKVIDAIHDGSQFNVFDVVNYALAGNKPELHRALNYLLFSGVEPPFVLWAITKELRNLLRILQKIDRGINLNTALSDQWASRKVLLKAAVARHTHDSASELLLRALHVDYAIKGIQAQNPWIALEKLLLSIAQQNKITRQQHD